MAIDLRSDTVTQPTDEMRVAMAAALVGDDVYGDDPTVNDLEALAATTIGKEAALFVPSGTMGNQIALMAHTARGNEVICDNDAHVFYYENAGAAMLAGCQLRTIGHSNGIIHVSELKKAIRKKDIHMPVTGLVWIENSHNRGGGVCYSPEQVAEIATVAHGAGIPIHCDGARIFNAALAVGCEVRELVKDCDSVMFCLSKGLCAPVGSILAGSCEFIERSRKIRKLLGGGMRQVGILAAAGNVALSKMVARLQDDHDRAKRLAEILRSAGVDCNVERTQTNIVLFDARPFFNTATDCVEALANRGVLASAFSETNVRFVLHHDIYDRDVDKLASIVKSVFVV